MAWRDLFIYLFFIFCKKKKKTLISLIDDKNIDMAKKCCGSDKSCITGISRLKLLDKKISFSILAMNKGSYGKLFSLMALSS